MLGINQDFCDFGIKAVRRSKWKVRAFCVLDSETRLPSDTRYQMRDRRGAAGKVVGDLNRKVGRDRLDYERDMRWLFSFFVLWKRLFRH